MISQKDVVYGSLYNSNKAAENNLVSAKYAPYQFDQDGVRHYLKKEGIDATPEQINTYVSQLKDNRNAVDTNVRNLFNSIMSKYGDKGYSRNQLYKRALRDAKIFGVEADQVKFFHMHYDNLINNNGGAPLKLSKHSLSAKSLGEITPTKVVKSDKVSPEDMKHQQDIQRLYDVTKDFDGWIKFVNMTYKDGNLITKVQNQNGNNIGNMHYTINHMNNLQQFTNPLSFVHPVIVAMFAPKIDSFDNRFTQASASATLTHAINETTEKIMLEPHNHNLLVDMITNPATESACSTNIWQDVKQRANIMEEMRVIISKMRMGLFYDDANRSLLEKLEKCKVSPYDSPNLHINQNPLVVAQRIMDAAWYKPTDMQSFNTIGAPMNMMQKMATYNNNYGLNTNMVVGNEINKTSMIHLNLPENFTTKMLNVAPLVSLTQALEQPQIVLDASGIYKQQLGAIVKTEGQITFAVERGSAMGIPKNTRVDFPEKIDSNKIGADYVKINVHGVISSYLDYHLKSVVTLNLEQDKVTNEWKPSFHQMGGQAYVKKGDDWYEYKPIEIMQNVVNAKVNKSYLDLVPKSFNAKDIFEKHGVLFFYAKDTNSDMIVEIGKLAKMMNKNTDGEETPSQSPSTEIQKLENTIKLLKNEISGTKNDIHSNHVDKMIEELEILLEKEQNNSRESRERRESRESMGIMESMGKNDENYIVGRLGRNTHVVNDK